MTDPTQDEQTFASRTVRGSDPADRYSGLWKRGNTPDLEQFLLEAGDLAISELTAILRIDQEHRFEAGDRVLTEVYLERHPRLRQEAEAVIDLIYGEYLLRERLGEAPEVAEYLRRFPEHAKVLAGQIELHKAMGTSLGQLDAGAKSGVATSIDQEDENDFNDPSQPPKDFGRYRLLTRLGRGGMGTVYRAHDTQLDQVIALKIPHFPRGTDRRMIDRFYREARAAASLSHPNLCPVYDVGEFQGFHYLRMPLLQGELLANRLERLGLLPENEAARIASRIAKALAFAHRAGIVHRDLKPANVMIGEDDEPIVMDFGLARRETKGNDLRLTQLGDVLGTPGYMSPEQIGGDSTVVGPATDIYSLGVLLYQLLSGRLPFLGPIHEVWHQALNTPPTPPSRIRHDLNPRLEAVCLRALAKNPKERFTSMEEFAEALDECLPVEQIITSQPQRAFGRRSLLIALALVTFFSIAIGLAIFRGDSAPTESRSVAVASKDPLPVGSLWSGSFEFRPPLKFGSDVLIKIEHREGSRFRGNYRTENDQYEWEFEGTVGDGKISWDFSKAIKDNAEHNVVGRARVYGLIQGSDMTLVFWQSEAEIADMKLHRDTP